MRIDELRDLVRRYWQAEAAGRSDKRSERLRVRSWDGDLYRIDEEVESVMRDRESGDRFLLSAVTSPDRPQEDWVVAWVATTIEDAMHRGDTDILERLVAKGMSQDLAARIRAFID
ncbi:hypothetical protein [Gryllotalpicola ginsengisoli]|uniref:hypothetical protein n=1 Tax=Gryllotalpicola ginsengisoli TaxID=444608 RepID=UPI0003B3EB91|nr:hypothetical protein [Gryllotalpicola ginsengisoli]